MPQKQYSAIPNILTNEDSSPWQLNHDLNRLRISIFEVITAFRLITRFPTCQLRAFLNAPRLQKLSVSRPAAQKIMHVIDHQVASAREKRKVGDDSFVRKADLGWGYACVNVLLRPVARNALRAQTRLDELLDRQIKSLLGRIRQRARP